MSRLTLGHYYDSLEIWSLSVILPFHFITFQPFLYNLTPKHSLFCKSKKKFQSWQLNSPIEIYAVSHICNFKFFGSCVYNQHKFFFLYYFFIPDSKLYDMSSQSSIQGNQPSTALRKPYIPKYHTKLQHECKYLWQYLAYFVAHFYGMNG